MGFLLQIRVLAVRVETGCRVPPVSCLCAWWVLVLVGAGAGAGLAVRNGERVPGVGAVSWAGAGAG